MSLGGEALSWWVQFEWPREEVPINKGKIRNQKLPEEVVGLLEVWTGGGNFVDEIFEADDALFAEALFNDFIVGQWNSLSVDLAETSLVDQSSDGLCGWVSVGDVRLDFSEHVSGSLVDLDEDGVVELSQSEELQDLSDGWVQVVDTKNVLVRQGLGKYEVYPRILVTM